MEMADSVPCSCPICGEEMISLSQLNKHIDDVHLSENNPENSPELASSPVKDIDLKKGLARVSSPVHSRTLGKKPQKSFISEDSPVRITSKNSSKHSSRNSPNPTASLRSDRKTPRDPPTVELTTSFISMREKFIEQKQIAQGATQRKFIKLANLMAESYIWHKQHTPSIFSYLGGVPGGPFTKEKILEAQKEIVGIDNWQDDSTATHCPQCFAKFNFVMRKHHCRLCGKIVNDGSPDSADVANFCSVQVPISSFLRLLPNFNYSPLVREQWDVLLAAETEELNSFTFRCCRSCKDLLLSGTNRISSDRNEILDAYNDYLKIKATILGSLARYEQLISENKDQDNVQINKLRVRLQKSIKDLELVVNSFMKRFFHLNQETQKFVPSAHSALVSNMYKAATTFLQDSILSMKKLNDEFSQSESRRLVIQQAASDSSTQNSTPVPPEVPRLTKRQIRELREQLMVLNEQAFIVDNQVEESRKARKFDEMAPLKENRRELQKRIDELVEELGEFGF